MTLIVQPAALISASSVGGCPRGTGLRPAYPEPGAGNEPRPRPRRRRDRGAGAEAHGMERFDSNRLAGLIGPLTRFFYALLGVALLSVLIGAPESALFFLVVGAAAQVLRAAIQELSWQREGRGPRAAR